MPGDPEILEPLTDLDHDTVRDPGRSHHPRRELQSFVVLALPFAERLARGGIDSGPRLKRR